MAKDEKTTQPVEDRPLTRREWAALRTKPKSAPAPIPVAPK